MYRKSRIMKKLKKGFYKKAVSVVSICVVLFVIPFVLAKCRKGAEPVRKSALQEFTESRIYKEFISRQPVVGKVDVDAARIVRVDNGAAMVHIPVMEHRNVEGAIIGIPLRRKGEYELMYQDNRLALSGTGNIHLYTSANELFAKIRLEQGLIRAIEPAEGLRSSGTAGRLAIEEPEDEMDCGYWCRVKRCYSELKKMFPGEMICDLLDLFFGVCTSATIASCLIKAAT